MPASHNLKSEFFLISNTSMILQETLTILIVILFE